MVHADKTSVTIASSRGVVIRRKFDMGRQSGNRRIGRSIPAANDAARSVQAQEECRFVCRRGPTRNTLEG